MLVNKDSRNTYKKYTYTIVFYLVNLSTRHVTKRSLSNFSVKIRVEQQLNQRNPKIRIRQRNNFFFHLSNSN